MKTVKYIFLCFFLSTIGLGNVLYAKEGQYKTGFSGNAIKGYDTVSYFKQGKAEKGKKEFSTKYNDATWLFSSAENLQLFQANPKKYVPQYGGYCAYAISEKNSLVSSDPEAWKIINNKLYLNYNKEIQQTWEKDKSNYIKKANANWINLSK